MSTFVRNACFVGAVVFAGLAITAAAVPGIGLPIAINACIGACQLADMAYQEQKLQEKVDFKNDYKQALSELVLTEDKSDDTLTDDNENSPVV